MLRRYRSPIALILAAALASPSGFAAPQAPKPKTVREELPEAARKDWDAARDLLDTSDFAGALVEYQRAYEQSKNPRVLYNVAICEKNLRHYARAQLRFKQELTDGAGKISAQEESDVKAAILALEPFVSTIDITSNEAGATLLIDGEPAGQTQFDKPVPIDVGPHEVRLHKDGFVDATQSVAIAGGVPGKATLNIDPAVKKASVSITVTGAPAASVVIDGIDMGQAPFKGEVVAGRHTFEARSSGFVTARQTTDVVYKEPLNLTLDLAVERHAGKLRIETTPVEASIELDGKVVGSGTWEGGLTSGGHQLIVKRHGYQAYTAEITISDDQSREVKATLLEEKGARAGSPGRSARCSSSGAAQWPATSSSSPPISSRSWVISPHPGRSQRARAAPQASPFTSVIADASPKRGERIGAHESSTSHGGGCGDVRPRRGRVGRVRRKDGDRIRRGLLDPGSGSARPRVDHHSSRCRRVQHLPVRLPRLRRQGASSTNARRRGRRDPRGHTGHDFGLWLLGPRSSGGLRVLRQQYERADGRHRGAGGAGPVRSGRRHLCGQQFRRRARPASFAPALCAGPDPLPPDAHPLLLLRRRLRSVRAGNVARVRRRRGAARELHVQGRPVRPPGYRQLAAPAVQRDPRLRRHEHVLPSVHG